MDDGNDDENDDENVTMNKNEDEEKDLEKGAMKPPALPRPIQLLEELKEKMMTCANDGTTTSSKYASIECELSSWRETEIIQFLVEKIRKNYYAKTTTNEDEDPIRVGRVFTAVNEGGLAVLVGEELRDKRSLGSVVRAAAAASAASAEKKDEEDTSSEGGAKKEGTKKKNSDEKNKKKLANRAEDCNRDVRVAGEFRRLGREKRQSGVFGLSSDELANFTRKPSTQF